MKSKLYGLLAVCLAPVLSYGQARQALQLEGSVKGTDSGKIYLQKFHNKMFETVDSATIANGRFSFHSAVELPELYGLTLDAGKTPYYIFLESGKINVKLDEADYYNKTVTKGSAEQKIFADYKKQKKVDIAQFIAEHPKSLAATYILYREYSYRLTPEEIEADVQTLDPALHQTQYVQVLNDLVKVMRSVAVGKKAPDFKAFDPQGNTVSLSEHLGKGYVLLDFWAAWCGPCRRENPNVVATYQKYKDKGFSVFGVSLDKTKDAWVKAIEHDQLNWTQVSDLTYWNSAPANLYGVRAIPSNFLIGPDGTIVARNLRGEELQKKLDELLHNQQAATD